MFGPVISMQLIQEQVDSLWKKIYLLACLQLIRKQEHNLVHKSQLLCVIKLNFYSQNSDHIDQFLILHFDFIVVTFISILFLFSVYTNSNVCNIFGLH